MPLLRDCQQFLSISRNPFLSIHSGQNLCWPDDNFSIHCVYKWLLLLDSIFFCSSGFFISFYLRLCFVFCFFLQCCLFYFVDFCPVSFHFSLFRFFLLCTKRSDFLQLYPKLTGQWASSWDLILNLFGLEMSKLFYSLFSAFYFFQDFFV